MRETERKFQVSPEFVMPRLPGASVDRSRVTLVARYHDTADLRLARRGMTLRHRAGGADTGWHLKLPVGDDPGTRDEITLHAAAAERAPAELLDLVVAVTRGSPVLPVTALVTERTAYLLRDTDGRPTVEVVDDVVSVRDGEETTHVFREVEAEDKCGRVDALDEVAVVLGRAGAVEGPFVPKAVRALGPRALEPPDPPPPVPPARDAALDGVLEAVLRAEVGVLVTQDLRARRGRGGALDGMRAACVRMRSMLEAFAPVLDAAWAESLRRELGWLVACLDADSRDALAALREERYVRLLDALVQGATRVPVTVSAAAASALPPLLRAAWHRLDRRFGELRDAPGDEAVTGAREAAAAAALAAEASAPVLGQDAAALAAVANALLGALLPGRAPGDAAGLWLRSDTAARAHLEAL